MPLFSYRVKDGDGQESLGKAPADSEEALADQLSRNGFFVLEITPEKAAVMDQDLFEMFQGVSAREYIMLLTHLYVALEAGLPIIKVLTTLTEQVKSKKLAFALKEVLADVKAGSPLSAALKRHPAVFSSYFSSMVGVGEATGALAESLKSLTVFLEKEEDFKQKTGSVFIYPVILLVVVTAVVSFLMMYIMPKFITIFASSKVELPLPTVILVFISNGMRFHWPWILGGLAAVVVAFKAFIATRSGRLAFDGFKLKMPIFGKIYQQIHVARFMNTFATLYSSGITIGTALSLVEENIGNAVFAKIIRQVQEGVEDGRPVSEMLAASGEFPSDSLMMIASGEESGQLPQMLKKTAELYEKDTEYTVKNLGALMEPLIILVMGGIVGFVALGILLPVFRLSTTVK
jgi:type II secretory pathway component PulF